MNERSGGPESDSPDGENPTQGLVAEYSGPPTIPLWELLGYRSATKAVAALRFAIGARRVIGEA